MVGAQARKKEAKPNFLVRISSGGVGVFHLKGWGPRSSACPSKPRETKFLRDIPGFLERYPGGARKVREKKVCVHKETQKDPPIRGSAR